MKKPLSFGATMLASACGVIIVSILTGLIMFIMTIAMVVSISKMGSTEITHVKANTFLSLDLGSISGDRAASGLALSFGDSKSMGLIDAENAIRAAATDDRIKGLYINELTPAAVSWGSLKELRDAVQDFRASGKPVVAYAVSFSQGGYYVASSADQICLHPSGMIDFRGFGAQVMYYKDLLDKLGVEMQLIRPESCSYKSAGEIYTMNHMSAANREQIKAYIGSLWKTTSSEIAASRSDILARRDSAQAGLTVADLNVIADDLSGYMADGAMASRLVDSLCFETDVHDMMRDTYGGKQLLSMTKYAANVKAKPNKAKDAIAVVYAEGDVVDGNSRGFADAVYGDDIVDALRKAAADDDVKAIVLRVNSPGGAATASESMTHAVMQAREKKPVVVSMGDLAASAGYEISCLADVIVAQPTTVTGSIGVFGTIPNFGKLMRNKLGLNVDTAQTNRNATGLTVMRPLSPAAMQMMYRNVEDFYKVFVGRVAQGRHLTEEHVHSIARGRVWTGADAIGIGLIDTLGGIDVAIRIAAERAGISDYRICDYPEEKDTWQQLSELLNDSGSDDDINLLARMRLAWQYKLLRDQMPRPLGRVEADLRYISSAEGLQARLPFIIIDE